MSREAVDRASTLKNMLEDSSSDYLIMPAAGGTDEGVRLVAAICEAGDGSTYPTDDIKTGALVEGIAAANYMDAGGALQCLASALFGHMDGQDTGALRALLGAIDDLKQETENASARDEPLFEPEHDDNITSSQPEAAASSANAALAPPALAAANFMDAGNALRCLASALFGYMVGQVMSALRAMLRAIDDNTASSQPEAAASSANAALAPPVLGRSMSFALGSDDAIEAALKYAPVSMLCMLKDVSLAWRQRARHALCSRACAMNGTGPTTPARREDITDLNVEFLIGAGRSCDVVAAARLLPGLARLHGYGYVVDVAAVRGAELRGGQVSGSLYDDEAVLVMLGGAALRTCITPAEGTVPRALLVAIIASLARGTVARVPVQMLREESTGAELDLRNKAIDWLGAALLALLLEKNQTLLELEYVAARCFPKCQ